MKEKLLILRKKENYIVFIIFCIFLIANVVQSKFVWLYHDDYGYASLSYAVIEEDVNGHEFSIGQLLHFDVNHYNEWGGRMLYFFFLSLILAHSIRLFYFIQSIIILGIFIYIFLILNKSFSENKIQNALLTVLMYGLIDIVVVRNGIYWATASVLYVWPLLPILAFAYHYNSDKKMNLLKVIILALTIFFAAWSQEQNSVIAVCYIGLFTLVDIYKTKKINKLNIVMLIVALIGFAILMLAPGSRVRMQSTEDSKMFYSLPIMTKINRNVPFILNTFFYNANGLFLTFLFLSLIIISSLSLKRNYGFKLLNYITLLSNIIIFIKTLFIPFNYYYEITNWFEQFGLKKIGVLIILIQLCLIAYNVLIYFTKKGEYKICYLFIGTIFSQIAMICSNTYSHRCYLMVQIISFIIITYSFLEILCDKDMIKNICVFVPLIVLSMTNFNSITKGYYYNNEVNKYNYEILEEASEKIKNGEKIDNINLKKLPNDVYSSEQPYMEGCQYIKYFMKQYFDIPESVQLIYDD